MKKHHGFTLLELIVVLAIIAIVSSIAVANFGNRNVEERTKFESYRFSQVVTLAQQHAILSGAEMGILVEKAGYRFFELKESKWQPFSDETEKLLQPYKTPEGVTVNFHSDLEKYFLDSEEITPQLFLLSSGEMNEFDVHFIDEEFGYTYRVVGNELGRMELSKWDEE